MKKDLGQRIRKLMVEAGIKTAKALADKINEEAGKKTVTPNAVNKWLSGQSQPVASSLMFLAKALRVSADIILFEDSDSPERTKELRKMVTAIVQEETKRVLIAGKEDLEKELVLFLNSKKIPQQDKKALLRQIKNLLKIYEGI